MRILVTGAWSCTAEDLAALEQCGHEVTFMQTEADALPVPYADVEGVVCNGLFLHHAIEKFRNLRVIQLTSAGTDRVPTDYVAAHGITLYTARGVYSIPMAEFAIGGVLQLCKKSRAFAAAQEAHRWEKQRDLRELSGKTVLILGCGSVGRECAKRFTAFGCRVYGVDLFPAPLADFREVWGLDRLEEALPTADVVVLCLPLTEDTRHLMNGERLSLLKPEAVLVNISRGAVVDTEQLARILPRIGGAVLDVFEEEPLGEDSPLWDMENVILTPHNSFVGDGNAERLRKVVLQNLEEKQDV